MAEKIRMQPYARLLTMLGEQLIRNEKVALIELIKNSYDADAGWVKISFKNFGEDYQLQKNSSIIIEDDGQGMSEDILRNHWVRPATPEKLRRKKKKATTSKGRVIQGEKGIGRFAVLKLGKTVSIQTKTDSDKKGNELSFDFSKFDDDFNPIGKESEPILLDKLDFELKVNELDFSKNSVLLGTKKSSYVSHGARIEITNLKGFWDTRKVEEVFRDVAKLESIFIDKKRNAAKNSFGVYIYKDDEYQNFSDDYYDRLSTLLDTRAAFKIEDGVFDQDKLEFEFKLNGKVKRLSLSDPSIRGLNIFSKYFGKKGEKLEERPLECGSFGFEFYVFDFRPEAPSKFKLDRNDKDVIKDHRIYLYRDNIRVYPYGEPDDDWLKIDVYRGTVSAAAFLSNDQVVGQVQISQTGNPNLKDKTNREGLIDSGHATSDFVILLQVFLAYFRRTTFAQYLESQKDKSIRTRIKNNELGKTFDKLKDAAKNDKKLAKLVKETEDEYKTEREYLLQRAETTEELAGVGLSVEAASHDIMSLMGKVSVTLDNLMRDLNSKNEIDQDEFAKELQSLRGMISFIESQLKDVQLLFKSSKQRRKQIRVKEILEKVERIYRGQLKKEKIKFSLREKGSPLIAKTTDAVLLQVLLNLFDNAIYWLVAENKTSKEIEVVLDGSNGKLIFSDNGPGIDKDDAQFIFEPFYSGRGEEGRGLGLYIAKQLLERSDYSIDLADLKSDKVLPGANFVLNFISAE